MRFGGVSMVWGVRAWSVMPGAICRIRGIRGIWGVKDEKFLMIIIIALMNHSVSNSGSCVGLIMAWNVSRVLDSSGEVFVVEHDEAIVDEDF